MLITVKKMFEEDIYLTIESEWRVFRWVTKILPIIQFPTSVVEQKRTLDLICKMAYLGWNHIVDVRLGDIIPHLLLEFENGQTLYKNGHHDRFESWNISGGGFFL